MVGQDDIVDDIVDGNGFFAPVYASFKQMLMTAEKSVLFKYTVVNRWIGKEISDVVPERCPQIYDTPWLRTETESAANSSAASLPEKEHPFVKDALPSGQDLLVGRDETLWPPFALALVFQSIVRVSC